MLKARTWQSFRTSYRSPAAWVYPCILTLTMSLIRTEGAVSHVSFSKGGGKFSYEVLHDIPAAAVGVEHRGISKPLLGFGPHESRALPVITTKTPFPVKPPRGHATLSSLTQFDDIDHYFNKHLVGPIPASLKSYFRSPKPSHYGSDYRVVSGHRPQHLTPRPSSKYRPLPPSAGALLFSSFPKFKKGKFVASEPFPNPSLSAFYDPIHGKGLKLGLWSPALGPPIRKPKAYHYSKGFKPGKLTGGFRPSFGPPGFKKPSYLDFAFYPSPSYFKLYDGYEENLVPYEDVAGSFSSVHGDNVVAAVTPEAHDLPSSFIRQQNLGLPVVLDEEGASFLAARANLPQEVTFHGFTGKDYKGSLVELPKLTPTIPTSLRTLVPPEPDVSPSEVSVAAVKANDKPRHSSSDAETSSTTKPSER